MQKIIHGDLTEADVIIAAILGNLRAAVGEVEALQSELANPGITR